MEENAVIAQVVFSLSLDRDFDYLVPAELRGRVRVGSRVQVEFNTGERSGYVVAMKSHSDYWPLKPIVALESEKEQIPESLVWLADWMADYYCCPKEHAVRTLLPAVVRSGEMKHKQALFVSLTLKAANQGAEFDKMSDKRKELIQYLRREGSRPLTELVNLNLASTAIISKMCEEGWLSKELRVVERDPFLDDVVQPDEPKKLTKDQQKALDVINASQDAEDSSVILLHGVTASGKTEVYLQAISRCLERGKEAIVLVPEISLTPQTCERFRRRFGNMVSVLHSGLSDGERFDEWTRINEGRSRIAVGARSALFAPFRNLGLIVVDEEHENSYKQDESPRYNARDMAVVRGKHEGATIVLGSATPSLESYYNCEQGRYKLVEMNERVDTKPLPSVELIDMGQEAAMAGKAQIFSNRLKELIFDRLQKAEQVILFLNRRGFATQMMCAKCGYVATCENCSVSYVYHKHAGMLSCHMCGAETPAPTVCPQCGDPEIRYSGFGTEKIETITHALFPKAKIARMDSDTMRTKDCYKKVLEEFRAGRINILIGTQMIAKGLDFPNVTLVGVVQADIGLHVPDFRSGERVFQLITQVAGRAGRGDTPGKVVVQTYTPDHFALRTAVRQDFHAFYEEEAPSRKMLDFPPCSHMVMIHFRSQEEALAAAAAEAFTEELKPQLEEKTQVIGPMPAPLSKVQKYFRYQLLLRGGNIRRLSRLLRSMIVVRKQPKNVVIYADVDPRNLL